MAAAIAVRHAARFRHAAKYRYHYVLAKPHGGQHVAVEKHVGSRHVGDHISRTDGDISIPKKDSGRAENPLQLVGTRFSSSSDRYFGIPRRAPKTR
jgi:hypothetical protein